MMTNNKVEFTILIGGISLQQMIEFQDYPIDCFHLSAVNEFREGCDKIYLKYKVFYISQFNIKEGKYIDRIEDRETFEYIHAETMKHLRIYCCDQVIKNI